MENVSLQLSASFQESNLEKYVGVLMLAVIIVMFILIVILFSGLIWFYCCHQRRKTKLDEKPKGLKDYSFFQNENDKPDKIILKLDDKPNEQKGYSFFQNENEEKNKIKPKLGGRPSGLKNNSTECYMNSMIQAVASSDKLIKQFKKIQSKNSKFESLNCFVELLQGVNTSDNSYQHLSKNTDLLEKLIRSVNWTKKSQQDAFELFSALVNGIHQDFKLLNLENFEMPMKLKMVYQFKGINIPNKFQYNLGLSLGLFGEYSTKPGVLLENLIYQYFQPTIIDDDPNKTSQITLFCDAPDVLLLHIQANKWDNEKGEMIKPKYHIQYDQEMKLCLNIVNELNSAEIKEIRVNYEIKAVVQHMGNISGGHYVTYRNWNDRWFLVNDEHVELITFNNDICPYILIYEKC